MILSSIRRSVPTAFPKASIHRMFIYNVFSIVTGMTISDYIRYRRLSLAGQELSKAKAKVIDIAFKYGYETPESFTRVFVRFHGITPSSSHKLKHNLKRF